MGISSMLSPLLLPVFFFSLLQTPTFALRKANSHYELLGSFVGSTGTAKERIFYSYTKNINGFAAILDEEEASQIAKHPNVVSVFLNKGRKLHTTRSWDFLRLERNGIVPLDSLWTKARFGEDTIIGNLDTGVWPESKSFSDDGMGPVPARWRGSCQRGADVPVHCNRKLIGAKYFNKGYSAFVSEKLNATFETVRDHDGHGSHTLSTAGGNFVDGASVFGHGNGTAKGGSPKARVAAYKVCWPPIDGSECFDADIVAAFDAAISDGVDVLSVSLGGGPSEFFEDGTSIGAFHAVKKGISVVFSAGNSGPTPGTAENLSPWMFTVGASTLDREFTSYVELGNNMRLKGVSLAAATLKSKTQYPLISAEQAKAASASASVAILCQAGSLDPKKVKGKILVCLRGDNARTDKGMQALHAGAVGMVLANDNKSGKEIIADPHLLPATHLNYTDGLTVFAYINSTKNPTAYITPVKTILDAEPAPFMASFSSRGPNIIDPAILKPDITAPGVSIIAAYSEAVGPTEDDSDKRRIPFTSESGTSMSCPHVSGIIGLLKSLHPDWSPAALKSAIMTTARTRDNTLNPMLDSDNKKATPFEYGAGHVRANRAMDPGLVYDLNVDDYLNYLCARGYNQTMIQLFSDKPFSCPKSNSVTDLNYPSITVPEFKGSAAIRRKVKNVGMPGTYLAHVRSPVGVTVTVKPSRLTFEKIGEELKFEVTFKTKRKVVGSSAGDEGYVFGLLTWSDGYHYVRSPLVVKHK
ncbi:Subtilisin-like protein protease [Hibiscus syriacus]|uniref:Subtilisin-like protein protease n=1 Tax=Hibiscus syriacus TaxID=106335 RepID=A0A6A3BA17_HIBSY|nr:subtilisin-like protease SBT5.4 [Hibiscus syriacus]KAE8713736.1 Subtilisin-like protein protease [Hibiscus syriacus]